MAQKVDENESEKKTKEKDQMKLPAVYDQTPLTKLNKNLLRHLAEQKKTNEEYTFAVLLTTGALNPIHLGHTDIMEAAKSKIETNYKNIKVIAGFMSPSHDNYLDGKFGKGKYISSEFRIKMVEMSTADSEWLTYDQWECKQKSFIDFPYVAEDMRKRMKKVYCDKYELIKTSKLRIYYVCGLDHANKCGLSSGLMDYGAHTLIVKRPNVNSYGIKSNKKAGVVVVEVPPVEYDRSSSIVRQLLKAKKWKELEKYLHPEVIQYLKQDPDKVLTFL